MTYKVGDIFVHKDKLRRKVLAVCGDVLAVSISNEYNNFGYWATAEELNELGYTLEEKPWEPELNRKYWFIGSKGADWAGWCDNYIDRCRRDCLGIYPTEEACEARIAEIKKLLGK